MIQGPRRRRGMRGGMRGCTVRSGGGEERGGETLSATTRYPATCPTPALPPPPSVPSLPPELDDEHLVSSALNRVSNTHRRVHSVDHAASKLPNERTSRGRESSRRRGQGRRRRDLSTATSPKNTKPEQTSSPSASRRAVQGPTSPPHCRITVKVLLSFSFSFFSRFFFLSSLFSSCRPRETTQQ